jgi:hypothetical protein
MKKKVIDPLDRVGVKVDRGIGQGFGKTKKSFNQVLDQISAIESSGVDKSNKHCYKPIPKKGK